MVGLLLSANGLAGDSTIYQYKSTLDRLANGERWEVVARSPACRQLDCTNILDVDRASHALLVRDTPNTLARTAPGPTPKEADRRARSEVRQAILSKPGNAAAHCAVLAAMTGRNAGDSAGYSDVLYAFELPSFLTSSQPTCLDQVMAALPRTEDADALAGEAHILCKYHNNPHCDRIIRPPVTSTAPPAPPRPPER